MSEFSISVLPPTERASEGQRLGRITIGDFSERFVVEAATPNGAVADLPTAWASELRCLISGASAVALRAHSARAWVLYREGEVVHVQEQLLVTGWQGQTEADGALRSLPARETVTEEGARISEWPTSLSAIREFLEKAS